MSTESPLQDRSQTLISRPATTDSPVVDVPNTAIESAWNLVNRLDFHGPPKPPTVLSVLRLYCIQGLTIPEVARHCGCSVGTVCNRLKLFRNATGHSPERLRSAAHPHRGRPKRQI